MKQLFKIMALLWCAVLYAPSVFSTNYYVDDSSGSNLNPGTLASPFATVNKGISVLTAGDSLFVKNGTYVEVINTGKHGTAANPIVIIAYPGHHPVIKPSGSGDQFVIGLRCPNNVDTAAYLEINGFEINGNDSNVYPLFIEKGHHITIRNCEISHAAGTRTCIYIRTGAKKIDLLSLNVHHATSSGIYFDTNTDSITLSQSESHDNTFEGVFINNNNHHFIKKNNIHNNGRNGIQTGANIDIYNNIVWSNTWYGIQADGATCRLYNNTFTLNGSGGIILGTSSISCLVKNNISVNNSSGNGITNNGTSNTLANNFTSGDPKFENSASADFHLKYSSPAIDKGTTLTEITDDYEGTLRTQRKAYDIGAFENTNANHGFYADANNGSDANPGTFAYPYATIMKGHVEISGGDTLYVLPGTYTEKLVISKSNILIKAYDPAQRPLVRPLAVDSSYATVLITATSGTSTNITLDGLILDGINQRQRVLDLVSTNYFIFRNGMIRNGFHSGTIPSSDADHITYSNLDVYNNGRDSVFIGSVKMPNEGDHGFYVARPFITIENCRVYNNAGAGIKIGTNDVAVSKLANNVILRNNVCYNNPGKAGILLNHTDSGMLVYNNICYNNPIGINIQYNAYRINIFNNTCYANNYGIYVSPGGERDSGVHDLTVKNNIAFKNPYGDLGVEPGYNLVSNIVFSDNYTGNPLFVDRMNADFRLIAGSPAIDAGVTIAQIPDDFYGTARPVNSTYDIGAYEGSGVATPYIHRFYTDGKTGNDNNPGTYVAPFKTINHGLNILVAGDTLYVLDATYRENINTGVHGTDSQPIYIMAYPGASPIIKPLTTANNCVVGFRCPNNVDTAAYLVFDGFTIDALDSPSSYAVLFEKCHDITMRNCDISNTITDKQVVYLRFNAKKITFDHCTIHHSGSSGLYAESSIDKVTIRHSEIYSSVYEGIVLQTASTNHLIEKSIVRNNGRNALSIGGNTDVYNNLLRNNSWNGIETSGSNCRFFNNTITSNDKAISLNTGSTSCLVKNNIVTGNASGGITDNGTNTLSNNFTSGNPLFVSPGSGDYHLQSTSTAINAGTSLTEITDDIEDIARNITDIGAYEYVAPSPSGPNTGIVETTNESRIILYPNPVNDLLYVQIIASSYNGNYSIELYDLNGRKLENRTFVNKPGENMNLQINTRNYSTGLYFLRIVSETDTVIKNFVIE